MYLKYGGMEGEKKVGERREKEKEGRRESWCKWPLRPVLGRIRLRS